VSKEGSERLIRAAISYSIANKRKTLTLVHKGNIQKFTEGAFRNWGYQLAEREFASQTTPGAVGAHQSGQWGEGRERGDGRGPQDRTHHHQGRHR